MTNPTSGSGKRASRRFLSQHVLFLAASPAEHQSFLCSHVVRKSRARNLVFAAPFLAVRLCFSPWSHLPFFRRTNPAVTSCRLRGFLRRAPVPPVNDITMFFLFFVFFSDLNSGSSCRSIRRALFNITGGLFFSLRLAMCMPLN